MRINSNVFNLDFGKLGEFLPSIFRILDIFIFLYSFLRPFEYIHGLFMANRNETIYKAEHNGQVCYLRGMLNDTFDVSQRRITIDEAPQYNPVVFYRRIENKPVIFSRRAQNNPVVFSKRGYMLADGYDFVVYVPKEYEGQDKRIRSQINYYKLAGKQYDVIYW